MTALRIVSLMLLALALGSCNPFPETWRWNQKLTVEISTPEGIVSGSAVTEVIWQERNSVGNFPGSYRGEATVVDLGQGRYLFALIGEPTRYLALNVFLPSGKTPEEQFAAMAKYRGEHEVPRNHFPILVTFDDINNPKTVREVSPESLSKEFGEEVELSRIVISVGNSSISGSNISRIIPWLSTIGDGMLDGSNISTISAENRLANDLTRFNFERK